MNHIAYYHYTRWEAFWTMMTPIGSVNLEGRTRSTLNSQETPDLMEQKYITVRRKRQILMTCWMSSAFPSA